MTEKLSTMDEVIWVSFCLILFLFVVAKLAYCSEGIEIHDQCVVHEPGEEYGHAH